MSSCLTRTALAVGRFSSFALLLAAVVGLVTVSGCGTSKSPASVDPATPPEAVSDLVCVGPTPDAITLVWTAPADARGRSGAYVYDVRRDTSEITGAFWDSAVVCAGPPVPAAPGVSETLAVRCLERETTYYFAMKSADADSNWSELSNCATGATPAGVEVIDQAQLEDDYGFGVNDEPTWWQEFRPTLGNLMAVEIYLYRAGSPGDVIIQITDTEDDVLATVTVPEASVPAGHTWVRADLPGAVCTVPGTKYRIHIASSQASPAPSDRYVWRGEIVSAYDSGCLTSVSTGWPTFDFSFKTVGYSTVK